ncbi:MAG TPA: class I SAM-dependent methyltransferase [Candidatus Tectomicrobia bacterium]|jgi:SAM-dependent methyltransferase
MHPKHKQFDTQYADIFGDASVVQAYQYRPPYPPETFAILRRLIDPDAALRTVLDAGCGSGVIARELVQEVERVDAVDTARRMIEAGKALPRGDNPKLCWLQGAIEHVPLQPPYALIVAAASLHWMHWETVMPRFHDLLTPGGHLAVVEEVTEPTLWSEALGFINEYSMNRDYQPYNMVSVTQELAARGLFKQVGMQTTAPMPFRQSVEAYIESFHARNGLSRDRLDAHVARAFDERLRQLVSQYCPNGIVELHIRGRVIWGKPQPTAF